MIGRYTPEPSRWVFPPATELPAKTDLITVGADLEPETLLEAYRSTYFPMPVQGRTIGWFSPDPRGVIKPTDFHVSRSLKKSARRFETTIDTAFSEVVEGCADPNRPHGWITSEIRQAYEQLHTLGWAHSVEVWDEDGLAGGVYGIVIGSFFAGESMFHRRTDASKVALWRLVDILRTATSGLLDVQWLTPHLGRLGATEVPRRIYIDLLATALTGPDVFEDVVRDAPPPKLS